MKIFVNNVDGYLAGAICADLFKLGDKIVGTRKTRVDELVPPMVKRIIPRVEVRRLLKAVGSSDVVVYDLHDADLEELELVLRILHMSDITQDMVFVLISSVGVWSRTHREYETLPCEVPEEDANDTEVAEQTVEGATEAEPCPANGGEDEEPAEIQASGEDPDVQPELPKRPLPLRSEEYTRRLPAPKFQEWKAIESQVLALKEKSNVRPYVVCAGIPYGNGEDAFLGLFKAAWQTRPTLRVIGDGTNFIPLVHARDVARLTRHVIETMPSLDYHLAVDRGQLTQRELVQAVADEFGIPYDVKAVTIPEAVLAELADVLTMDLRMVPSALMDIPYVEEVQPPEEELVPEAPPTNDNLSRQPTGLAPSPTLTVVVEGPEAEIAMDENRAHPLPFRWWSEHGLAANIGQVAREFCTWRRLDPIRFLILGPPGCGAERLGARIADRYCVPLVEFDAQVNERRTGETPLGQQLRNISEQITGAIANPKAQGPFFIPPLLAMQVMEAALEEKPTRFRGAVITGFPCSAEEAIEFFLEDAPPPPEPADDSATPAGSEPKVVKQRRRPDVVVILSSSDEACLQRMQEDRPIPENEFGKRMDRWKKECPAEGPGLADVFREKFAIEPLCIDVDDVTLEAAEQQVMAELEGKRRVFNFMPSPRATVERETEEKPTDGVGQEEEEARLKREMEERKRQKEQEEALDLIKREELLRLEKHSEPLRQYLMTLVVPTLTSGLIEVCSVEPEDPVGYLAEYLAVYAQVTKQRAKNKARGRATTEAST